MPTETPIYFTNIFTMLFGDNDVLIKFGIEDREANTTPKTQIAQTAVIMTPRSAKIMAAVLNGVIEKFEATVGPISIPESKMEDIKQSLEAMPVKREPKV